MERNYYCCLDGKHYSKIGIVRIIKKHGIGIKDFYDLHFKQDGEGICTCCGKETKFIKFAYRKFCSLKCASVINRNVTKIYSEKNRESTIQKLKDYRRNLTQEQKAEREAKRMKTFEENVGVSYVEFQRQKMLNMHENMTAEEKAAYFDHSTSMIKNPYGNKKYMLNNKTVTLQGYEPQVLDVLKTIFDECDINAGRCCMLHYIKDGERKRYFPDIIVGNILIEVKSFYTLKLHAETTLLKMQCSKDAGYVPLLVLWNPMDEEMCKNSLIETISSQDLTQQVRFNDYPFIGVGNKLKIAEALGIQI